MNRLKAKYNQEVVPALIKSLQVKTSFQVPKLQKIVVNMGVSDPQDPRARKQVMENIAEQFKIITGQKPQITKAKKAISSFKLRAGDPLGLMVTLRGEKMWQFLDKLISIVLPRVKDFRGISNTAFDGRGNYSLGLNEQIVFSELSYDQIEKVRGLQINLITNFGANEPVRTMLELLGLPFAKENK
ncbi:50S ribosomal protein L5 [Microgenomates group bacterium]|nr:50S ribosomal protein L5 [Microgenomates group bacterium]